MKKFKIFVLLSLFLSAFTCNVFAQPSDQLMPLLIDVDGYGAEEAEGETMDMVPGMKIITASRYYTGADGEVVATILVGNNAMVNGHVSSAKTADGNVEVMKVKGFDTIHAYSKEENAGYFIVTLKKGTKEGAMFMISYQGVATDDALDFLKEYDLETMEELTDKMVA